MADDRERVEQALRKATGAALAARKDLDAVKARRHGPIAIVGAGLRMPGGATDLEGLWQVLASGADTVRPLASRFEGSELSVRLDGGCARHASLLEDVAGLDAAFFGISPREALPMDPQHRLLLEAAWTALEDAGFDPRSLAGSGTGVFVGIGPNEYGRSRGRSLDQSDAYDITGRPAQRFGVAGRLIAYHLGLQGPALSVDTACSSSLVALHLAVEHLRSGRCDLAVAAAVQVIADPEGFVLLARARATSLDGRSKTFSANADGYGRGEGVGAVVLMNLDDARAQGRRISRRDPRDRGEP